MKTQINKITVAILVTTLFFSCNKSDDTIAPEPENQAPTKVILESPSTNQENVAVLPTFTWQGATDPEGDAITYEIYADETDNPTTLVGTTTNTSFELTERLHLVKNYNWKIVAKDSKGASSTSNIATFTTRDIRFNLATANVPFSPRQNFGVTIYNNKLWISGGFSQGSGGGGATRYNDVWFTEDGTNWTQATSNAITGDLNYRVKLLTFKNKLWLFGDQSRNDVWNSTDGVNWSLITESTGNHGQGVSVDQAFVFKDKMVLIYQGGGVSASTDGIVWTVLDEHKFGSITDLYFSSGAIFGDKIWMVGGTSANSARIISSADGANWTVRHNGPPFDFNGYRTVHTVSEFDNNLYLYGGVIDTIPRIIKNDLWRSEDGIIWKEITNNSPLSKRVGMFSIVFKDKLWLLGGQIGNTANRKYFTDVWYID